MCGLPGRNLTPGMSCTKGPSSFGALSLVGVIRPVGWVFVVVWICVTLCLGLHPAADCGRLIADFLRMPCRREQRARGKEKKKKLRHGQVC